MSQATIYRKSAGSTEVVRVLTTEVVNGAVQNPTGNAVSAAVVSDSDYRAGIKRAPVTGDFVAQTWETDAAGPQYWAAVLMGPSATLNPAGPSSSEAQKLYRLWLRIVAGSEDLRREVGFIALTP